MQLCLYSLLYNIKSLESNYMAELLSTAEVARRLGTHHYSVCRIIREGRLSAQKIGKTWVVREEDLDELAENYEARRGRPRTRMV